MKIRRMIRSSCMEGKEIEESNKEKQIMRSRIGRGKILEGIED